MAYFYTSLTQEQLNITGLIGGAGAAGFLLPIDYVNINYEKGGILYVESYSSLFINL